MRDATSLGPPEGMCFRLQRNIVTQIAAKRNQGVAACELLSGNRARIVLTNAASAFSERISSGEKPLFRAIQNIAASPTPVIRKFWQALSAHCPRHTMSKR